VQNYSEGLTMTQLSFSLDTPRGPVTVTSDLSGLKTYELDQEVAAFFNAILILKCQVYTLEREAAEREKKQQEQQVSYTVPAALEPVMVVS